MTMHDKPTKSYRSLKMPHFQYTIHQTLIGLWLGSMENLGLRRQTTLRYRAKPDTVLHSPQYRHVPGSGISNLNNQQAQLCLKDQQLPWQASCTLTRTRPNPVGFTLRNHHLQILVFLREDRSTLQMIRMNRCPRLLRHRYRNARPRNNFLHL